MTSDERQLLDETYEALRIARADLDACRRALAAGWALSTWVATVQWSDREPNTQRWLDQLKDRIKRFQVLIRAAGAVLGVTGWETEAESMTRAHREWEGSSPDGA